MRLPDRPITPHAELAACRLDRYLTLPNPNSPVPLCPIWLSAGTEQCVRAILACGARDRMSEMESQLFLLSVQSACERGRAPSEEEGTRELVLCTLDPLTRRLVAVPALVVLRECDPNTEALIVLEGELAR